MRKNRKNRIVKNLYGGANLDNFVTRNRLGRKKRGTFEKGELTLRWQRMAQFRKQQRNRGQRKSRQHVRERQKLLK